MKNVLGDGEKTHCKRKRWVFTPFDLFSARQPWGEQAVFDFPIYQYLVATFSLFLNQYPLVLVRYVNLFLWMITAFFGFRICESIGYRLSVFVVF